jgi:methylmalonyl-CoA/ethylmalonyl-CoA epimerase
MFKKINHIGIVVSDFQEAMTLYSKGLGMELDKTVEISDVQLKIGVFKIGGIEIELLHYGNTDMPMVKALRGDQPGVNHICYEVKEFDDAMKRLTENGFKLIEGFPRKGVHGRIAFFIPPHSEEERIEILEVEPKDE